MVVENVELKIAQEAGSSIRMPCPLTLLARGIARGLQSVPEPGRGRPLRITARRGSVRTVVPTDLGKVIATGFDCEALAKKLEEGLRSSDHVQVSLCARPGESRG